MNSFETMKIPSSNVTAFCRLCLSVSGELHQLFRSDETDALAIPLSMKVSLCTATAVSTLLSYNQCQDSD